VSEAKQREYAMGEAIGRVAKMLLRVGGVLGALCLPALGGLWACTVMPGSARPDEDGTPTEGEAAQKEDDVAGHLRADVEVLAEEIGPRHHRRPQAYRRAAEYIEGELEAVGYEVRREDVSARGQTFPNLIAERAGKTQPAELVVVGAHYDTAYGTPGADDNASGVAGVLELARRFSEREPARTVRFVLFANEEPPFFQTEEMGSLVHARSARASDESIVVMLSLEMLGYYEDEAGTQRYPFPLSLFYPDRGDFLAFVGLLSQRGVVARSTEVFRREAKLPSEGFAGPGFIPGVGLSDHWSFWQEDFPALMVTDTAFFRNSHYHRETDTAGRLDYERMARAVEGLEAVIASWASGDS
jgi:hypothetical protein